MPDTLESIVVPAPAGPLVVVPSSDGTIMFSIIVPTFNEGENIAAFLSAIRQNLDPVLPDRYEIIVVDDDSSDRTWETAAQSLPGFTGLRVVRRQRERGLATGVMRGYQIARGEILGTINADFQHPPGVLLGM